MKDSIPWTEFKNDSLFDVNGDKSLDFLVVGQFSNGRYNPSFGHLYCFNPKTSVFIRIDKVSSIPNPHFIPLQKRIVGKEETDSCKYFYNYLWENGINLITSDTVIYHKVINSIDYQ